MRRAVMGPVFLGEVEVDSDPTELSRAEMEYGHMDEPLGGRLGRVLGSDGHHVAQPRFAESGAQHDR